MFIIKITTCVLLVTSVLLPSSQSRVPLVKACGMRELMQVMDAVCSTLGQSHTDSLYSSLFGQRMESKSG